MALVLPALFPPDGGISASRAAAFLALPSVGLVALVAQLSLRGEGGADCLGWTATAVAG